MIKAYVLIQTEIGTAREVWAGVAAIPGVSFAVTVTGPYDVLAYVTAADLDALGKIAVGEIQAIAGVSRTLTCPVVNF
jgi:DNA-binding Lrp family transcriptional regulator